MIDLNKHFIEFAKKASAQSRAFSADDHMVLDKLMFVWQNTPAEELEGKSPRKYVEELTAGGLIEALKCGVNNLLTSRIGQTAECAPLLKNLIATTDNQEIIEACVDLLPLFDTAEPLAAYVSLLKKDIAADLKEKIIDRLKVNVDAARPILLEGIDKADNDFRTIAGEILLSGEKSEDTFKLLVDLFLSGKNTPLYANYLGKYGDERAAAYLYPALDKADYVDFIEIKNAIERLGGLVDDTLRDFTLDPLYQLIKQGNDD